jgi:lipid A disaccharide synthetase
MQEDMTPAALAQAVWDLLENPERRAEISRRFATLRGNLALGADDRAAEAIIDLAT